MILQALYQLAMREGLTEDPDFEPRPVAYLVRIGKNGRLVGPPESTHSTAPPEEGRKRKPKPVPKTYMVPRQPPSRSGTKAPPFFMVDNAKYVFGRPTADKNFTPEEGAEKANWFRDLINTCARDTGDEAARTVVKFLENVAAARETVEIPNDCKSNDLFGFIYQPATILETELVHVRPRVRAWWVARRSEAPATDSVPLYCLVSGRPIAKAEQFPKIDNLPGGNTAGAALVSFNRAAFESYGLKKSENAPISRDAAEACAAALNRLLHREPHRLKPGLRPRRIDLGGDTAVCFWAAERPGDEAADALAALFGFGPDPAVVGDLYRSIWSGRPPHIEDPTAFYALTISGAEGRAVVRDWFESSVSETWRHIATWFHDLALIDAKTRESDEPPPLWRILQSLVRESKDLPPSAGRALWRAAVKGEPIPFSIVHRALGRLRAEVAAGDADAWSFPRMCLLKAYWCRRSRQDSQGVPAMLPHLNKEHPEKAYHCGRMMAVLEHIQRRALQRELNATVIQKYYAAASVNPRFVLPRLLRMAKIAHLPGIEDPRTRDALDAKLREIHVALQDDYPLLLDIGRQSFFALGYYQQQADLPDWHAKAQATERGDLVRSKSELIIADRLFSRGVNYEYEKPLESLARRNHRPPDFTIEVTLSGKPLYIEYLGGWDNLQYRERWERKLGSYRDAGILPHEEGGGPNGTLLTAREESGRFDIGSLLETLDALVPPSDSK